MPYIFYFIIPLNKKTNHIKYKPNMGFLSVSKMVREGGGGVLFEGGDYFKYFGQRGAIIRGRRLIEGLLLFKDIQY